MGGTPEVVDERKVYRPVPTGETSALVFAILFLFMLLLVPFIGVFAEYRKTGDISGFWIGMLLLLGVLIVAAVVRSRRRRPVLFLALSPSGLDYQVGDRTISVAWADVVGARLDDDPFLVVRVSSSDPAMPRPRAPTQRISLLPFDTRPDGELVHDLRRWAAHLFEGHLP